MTYPSSIVFIGDSITASMPLGRYLPQAVNKGVAGDTTSMMANRYWADVVSQAPDVVVILGGTNNIIGSPTPPTIEDLEWMAQQAKTHNIKPVICTIPPMAYVTQDRAISASEVVAFNTLIAQMAVSENVPLADYYSVLALANGVCNPLLIDAIPNITPPMRVHPSPAGYDAMFEVLSPILLTI